MAVLFDAGSALSQAYGFDAEVKACGCGILAHTFESQRVRAGLGPEVQEVMLMADDVRAVQIDHRAQLDAIERGLVLSEVLRTGHGQKESAGFSGFHFKGDFNPGLFLGLGHIE